MFKLIAWIGANIATIIGVLQAVVKLVKEVITGVVNVISLFMTQEQAEASVSTLRSWVNKIDDILQWLKEKML